LQELEDENADEGYDLCLGLVDRSNLLGESPVESDDGAQAAAENEDVDQGEPYMGILGRERVFAVNVKILGNDDNASSDEAGEWKLETLLPSLLFR
jgi:hypothetical protein